MYCKAVLCLVIHVQLFVTPWTVVCQAPLSVGILQARILEWFSRQEYWSELPCPPPADLPNPGIEPWSPALQVDFFNHLSHQGIQFSSVTQSCLTLQPRGLQHARLPCPSPTPRACSNSCPSSQWCHPTISSSVVPFSSCLQSCPTTVFVMYQF